MPMVWSHEDLRVTVSCDIKTTANCHKVLAKRFETLWALRRTFTNLDTNMFTTEYTTLVRSKLENCVQTASSCLKGDLDILEKVQRKATCEIPELRGLPYKEWLEKLYLIDLFYRRLSGDLIVMYRIIRNDSVSDISSLFLPSRS